MKPRAPVLSQPVVLLVEDEPLVRLTQVDILREAGFWVAEADNADEAFEILRRRQDVRAVLTDVDMPGSLDGFEFARLVAQGWPEVGVLVISGKAFPEEGDLPSSAQFLAKPTRPEILLEKLEALVGRRGSAQDCSQGVEINPPPEDCPVGSLTPTIKGYRLNSGAAPASSQDGNQSLRTCSLQARPFPTFGILFKSESGPDVEVMKRRT